MPLTKQTIKTLFIALPIAFSAALAIHLQWNPHDITAGRSLALIAGLTVVFTAVTGLIIARLLASRFRGLPRSDRWILVLTALFIGSMGFWNLGFEIPDRYLFLPRVTLVIINTGEKNSRSEGNRIELKLFETGTTDSFNAFEHDGDWRRSGNALVSDSPAVLRWSGPVFQELRLTFRTGPTMGIVDLSINGSHNRVDLFDPQANEQYLVTPIPLPWLNRPLMTLIFWLVFSFLSFLVLIFLRLVPLKFSRLSKNPVPWLWYALPMILVWGTVWLTYFPALMSQDSAAQWLESVRGQFTDWHPAIYAILMRIFSFGMSAPAAVPAIQILLLASITARALHFLEERGVPRAFCWLTAALFALSPVPALFQSSIWKDVAFGMGFFACFIQLNRIVFSNQEKPVSKRQMLWLSLSAAATALFRHNGLPVVLAGFTVFLLEYRKSRRFLWKAFILTVSIILLVRGPLYSILRVELDNGSGANQILNHAISAHVAEGTPLNSRDTAWLNGLYPLEDWIYNPWTAGSLLDEPAFNREKMYANTAENLSVLAHLTLSAPLTTVRHLLRASDMIWRIPCRGCYLYKVVLSKQPDGSYEWIAKNNAGLKENSKIPGLVVPLYRIYEISAREPLPDALIWRPAFASWWIFLIALLKALRCRNRRILMMAALPFFQFLLMLAITFAQDMRFQYGVILCAMLSTAFFFIPEKNVPQVPRA